MASIIAHLHKKGLIRPPDYVLNSTCYETITGSVAYGVSSDTSDMDVVGFCIPAKEIIFPHLTGEIPGFGTPEQRWNEYQQHHIRDEEVIAGGRSHDIYIYNIVKYFDLLMDNNPNIVDSIFTPDNCVLHSNKIAKMVRDARKSFLHKGSYHKFKGYAYSQLHKMTSEKPEPGSKRAALREQFGFDVKFAYHVVRLVCEAEQILILGDLDIQRDREHLKSIRRGDLTEQQIRDWFVVKLPHLENLYASSQLQDRPDEGKIKTLLLQCLEEHFGSLSNAIVLPDANKMALLEIKKILERTGL